MNPLREQQLAEIRSLTQHMLSLSEKDDWQELTELEASRRGVIRTFFDEKPTADEAPTIASTIQEVLEADRQIIERGAAARDSAATEMRNMGQNVKAVKAYDDVTR